MASKGRPVSNIAEQLGFAVNKLVNSGKTKTKYVATCLSCKKVLTNTANDRLKGHRRVCNYDISEQSEDMSDKSCSEETECSIVGNTKSVPSTSTHSSECEPESSGNLELEKLLGQNPSDNNNIIIEYIDIIDEAEAPTATPSNRPANAYEKMLEASSTSLKKKKKVAPTEATNPLTSKVKQKKRKLGNITRFVDTLPPTEEENINEYLAKFFFGCNIPFSVVDSIHFKNLIKALRPSYAEKLPGRKALSTTLLDASHDKCLRDSKSLCPPESVILIDGWKNESSNTKTVVTIIHNAISGSQAFLHAEDLTGESETGDKLLEVVEKSINIAKVNYQTKVYGIVSDNAANMRKMGRLSNLWHSTCHSHTANLLAKDISSSLFVRSCLENSNLIIKEFKHPDNERAIVNSGGTRLKSACETRWCSNRDSLFSVISNLSFMRQVAANAQNYPNMKIKQEVKILLFDDNFEESCAQCIKYLDPICELINKAQSTTCSIADMVDIWLNLLIDPVYDDTNFHPMIEKRAKNALNTYALVAYYFHPKKDISKLSSSQQDDVNTFLIRELNSDGFKEWTDYRENKGIFDLLKNKNIDDPIIFWKTAQVKVFNLASIALRLLQMPASSAQIERVFSNWSFVHSTLRNRLSFEKSKKLLFIYYTLKLLDTNNSDDY